MDFKFVKQIACLLMIFLLTCCAITPIAQAGGWNEVTLLNAVTKTTDSTAYEIPRATRFTVFVTSSGTVSATMLVQVSADNTNWSTIETLTLSAEGTRSVAVGGVIYRYVRVSLSSYSSGTFSAKLGWD